MEGNPNLENATSVEQKTINALEKIGAEMKAALADVGYKVEAKKAKAPNAEVLKKIRDQIIASYPEYRQYIIALIGILCPSVEWTQTSSHLTFVHKTQPEVLKKFWELAADIQGNSRIVENNWRGLKAHAAAMMLFEELGFQVRAATSLEDKTGTDFLVNDIPVQVKSASKNKRSVLSVHTKEHIRGEFISIKINVGKDLDPETGIPKSELIEEIRKLNKKNLDWVHARAKK